jgi:SRSO17 transposase
MGSKGPRWYQAYLAFAPAGTAPAALVGVAEMRWTVEESFPWGLDQYEVRNRVGWYLHITLTMWAHAFLAVIRAETGATVDPKKVLLQPQLTYSLAAFKRQRGLTSD